MRDLGITLLGSLYILLDGKAVNNLDSDKTRALLVYLAVEADKPQRRDFLAEMFWPGKPEGVGRDNLKQALSNLRKALRERNSKTPFLLISREEIQFNSGSHFWIDANEFQELLTHVDNHDHPNLESCQACAHWLQQATGLYRGDFLEQFSLRDSPAFDEWILVRREAYQRRMSGALRNLILIHEASGDIARACECAKQLVALEPWNEENHRHFMRLLALHDMRSAALKQYHDCRRILMDELGVEPSDETNVLYEQIKNQELEVPGDELVFPESIEPSGQVKKRKRISPFFPRLVWGMIVLAILLGMFLGFSGINHVSTDPFPQGAWETSYFIYNDKLSEGWEIFPWGGQADLKSSDVVYEGSYAIKISLEPEGGIMFNIYPPSDGLLYTHLAFYLNSVETSDQQLYLEMKSISGSPVGKRLYLDEAVFVTDSFQSGGSWRLAVIPLAALNPLGLPFGWFDLGYESGVGSSTFYVDDLRFVDINSRSDNEDGDISEDDLLILAALYDSTNGENWIVSNGWMTNRSPCEWHGVTCKGGNITELRLANNNLSGSIPPELGYLKGLEVLQLSNNLLTGPLPPELGNLSNLTRLYVSNNAISGPLPAGLGNLTNLEGLDLSNNQLSGPLPAGLGNLSKLRYLTVHGNSRLNGNIPPELGRLSNLEILILAKFYGGSQLSGAIPPELGRLGELMYFQIGDSQLSGSIPPELGNLTNLVFLDLYNNPLSSSIPPELGNLIHLHTLLFGGENSELEGPLPTSLVNIKHLDYFRYDGVSTLCVSQTPEFQAWLDSIRELDGPRIMCK